MRYLSEQMLKTAIQEVNNISKKELQDEKKLGLALSRLTITTELNADIG